MERACQARLICALGLGPNTRGPETQEVYIPTGACVRPQEPGFLPPSFQCCQGCWRTGQLFSFLSPGDKREVRATCAGPWALSGSSHAPGAGETDRAAPPKSAQRRTGAPTGQCSPARPRRPRDLRQPRASEHRLLRIARWHPRNHSPRCPARVLGAQFCPGSRPRRCLHPSDTGTAAISAGGLGERGGHGRDSRVHKQQRCEIPHGTGSALRPTSSPPAP